jgi:phosphoribosylformimino-5-aminoimidazole carboxamide ribotide isomerase
MRIIPAIDIIDGKCVRLTQGDYDLKKVYHPDPVVVARELEQAGIRYLHVVDLDGAKAGKLINQRTIEAITSSTRLMVDAGGGIKTQQDIDMLLQSGVKQVNIGSVAVKNPDLVTQWIAHFGAEVIILSADILNGCIAMHGWQEKSLLTWQKFLLDYTQRGILYVTCTDISKDGMLRGPNIGLYDQILTTFPTLRLIASGGVSSREDVVNLRAIPVDGVIIGKAYYEGRLSLNDLKELNHAD